MAVKECSKFGLYWLADYDRQNDYPMKVSLELADPKTVESIRKMKEIIKENLVCLRAGDFPPRSKNNLCFSCEYKNICNAKN